MSDIDRTTPAHGTDPATAGGRRSRVFDIRAVIAAVFTAYGILVGAAGISPNPAGLVKSQGININLWTGAGMLVVAALFWLWLWLRPLTTAGDPAP
ncbi:hypothetical protein ACLFMI_01615 [Pseudonocardia nantongensis]|uniref:hypothetical protein n=1 Tax=Pseudonocardia nantongensis TaxID=1181885 RepID=UPI0039791AD2